ncbi:MAG: hypothetical protein JWR42_661 [Marmoricola sp.]|nr:hypothetical protein [Marmoricola sp.]
MRHLAGLPRRERDEEGAVALLFAALSLTLLLVAGMVVDLGLARDTRGKSQISSDAAALAAANATYPNGGVPNIAAAVAAAKSYAAQNFAVAATDWSGCVDDHPLAYLPDAGDQCISFNSQTNPTQVRVRMPVRSIATTLGVLAGVQSIPISTSAGAQLTKLAKHPCGFCVLGSGTHNFQNGDVTLAGADIYINGSADVGSNGLIATDGKIYVQNDADGPLASYEPDPITHVPAITDPLAQLPLPPDFSALQNKTDPCTQGPGIYTGQNLNNKTCNLLPGLYVIRAGTWDGSGNQTGRLAGTGVTLYFTCSNGTVPAPCAGTAGADLDVSGNYSVAIQAPTSGPLAGLAIVYDRQNTSMLRMTGNGSAGFTGTIYARSSTLQINGNGCNSTYNSLIVTNNVDMNGNPTCIKASYDVTQNTAPPPGIVALYQ